MLYITDAQHIFSHVLKINIKVTRNTIYNNCQLMVNICLHTATGVNVHTFR